MSQVSRVEKRAASQGCPCRGVPDPTTRSVNINIRLCYLLSCPTAFYGACLFSCQNNTFQSYVAASPFPHTSSQHSREIRRPTWPLRHKSLSGLQKIQAQSLRRLLMSLTLKQNKKLTTRSRHCANAKPFSGAYCHDPRKEDYLLHPPRLPFDDLEEPYCWLWLTFEYRYWNGELRAWEAQLTRIQRDWQKRNDAAGGTVPPPPPVVEMDPLELHIDYLKLVRKMVKDGGRRKPVSRPGWFFKEYPVLLEHYQCVQQLVKDMRMERGLSDEPLSTDVERAPGTSNAAPSHSGGRKRKRPEESDPAEDKALNDVPDHQLTRRQPPPSAPAYDTAAEAEPSHK